MKLDCSVVRDLYLLYVENELSPEVRTSVEEHLDECGECRKLYEEGVVISEVLSKEDNEVPSRKLDEKMLLKLKVGRLKVGVLVLAIMFFMSVFNYYSSTRQNLNYDLSRAIQPMGHIWQASEEKTYIDTDFLSNAIFNLNDQNSLIDRDLNFIEKAKIKNGGLFLNPRLVSMSQILKYKTDSNVLNPNDKKMQCLLQQYTYGALKLLEDENHSFGSYSINKRLLLPFKQFKSKELSDYYSKLNNLTLVYTKYYKLPEEIKIMPKDKLIEIIRHVFNDSNANVKFYNENQIKFDGTINFDIKLDMGDLSYWGTIDAYTGRIIKVNESTAKTSGELLPVATAQKNALEFLKREYGDDTEFKLEYLGVNYHFSSNTDIKIHSFRFVPVIKGYEFYLYNADINQITLDARTGELYSLNYNSGDGIPYIKLDNNSNLDTTIKVIPEDGLKTIDLKAKERYIFQGTYIINSAINNKYTLVHVYKPKETNEFIYINTISGKQDFEF